MPSQPSRRLHSLSSATEQNLDAVYQFIVIYLDEHGYPPTMREMAEGCYINVAYVVRYLDLLEAQGRLTREAGKARSVRLTPE
jgi:SOS-response transcriptional repressor LexA